ncbi:hypothetical protein [Kozakia baliensis]|uniref:hypothetical protein n=1 Tax=Kozakia baliensis TaxID=153496 RepID=UPI00087CD521|nr:hypothetical protein [Kozakia baliensis]AOX19135.1 hypothetical protein A0U90_01185 [Kozakia baliensis]
MMHRPDPELQRLPPHSVQEGASDARPGGALGVKLAIAAAALLASGALATHNFYSSDHKTTPAQSAQIANQTPAAPHQPIHAAAQFAMIAPENAARALQKSRFSQDQRAQILAAVKRRDVRLVEMPVADASGQVGQAVSISSAGITQTVVLTGKLQSVLLPIRNAGEVTVTPVTQPRTGGLQTGVLTALGPEVLPTLSSLAQQIILDVIVQ